MSSQNFRNHAKMVPSYHYLTSPLALFVLIAVIVQLVREPSLANVVVLALVLVVLSVYFHARIFALGVQDRVIRLEEQLRMERILPEDLRTRIGDFTMDQLIGLRFASDEELPELARRVLDGELPTRKEIKAAVRHWRADHARV